VFTSFFTIVFLALGPSAQEKDSPAKPLCSRRLFQKLDGMVAGKEDLLDSKLKSVHGRPFREIGPVALQPVDAEG
jgi:hypothetical protein